MFTARIKRILWLLCRPMIRWSVRDTDPWSPIERVIAFRRFGEGSIRDFKWYFEGSSKVTVENLEGICEWLRGCTYAEDPELFNEPDFWQHPKTFEALRQGDCEDHALWAWRKLTELQIASRLYVGHRGKPDHDSSHAWVVLEQGESRVVLETVAKGDPMLKPLEEVRSEYIPHFSVSPSFETRAYVGYLHWLLATDSNRFAPRAA